MKTTILSILISVILTFTITENYMLSNMEISSNADGYTVTIFGADFNY